MKNKEKHVHNVRSKDVMHRRVMDAAERAFAEIHPLLADLETKRHGKHVITTSKKLCLACEVPNIISRHYYGLLSDAVKRSEKARKKSSKK
jgi:hypothetical protein